MPAERVVVVTGGSRGIGAEVVARAAAAGWTVCFSYVAADQAANEAAERVRAAGGKAVAVRADISVEGDVVGLFEAAGDLGPIGGGEYIDYAASKGAVDTLGLGLAQETAPEGIRVNVVRPGPISTDLHERNGQPTRLRDVAGRIPLGRAGEPEEVAEAIMWLLGDASSFCTGSILDVAGGR